MLEMWTGVQRFTYGIDKVSGSISIGRYHFRSDDAACGLIDAFRVDLDGQESQRQCTKSIDKFCEVSLSHSRLCKAWNNYWLKYQVRGWLALRKGEIGDLLLPDHFLDSEDQACFESRSNLNVAWTFERQQFLAIL